MNPKVELVRALRPVVQQAQRVHLARRRVTNTIEVFHSKDTPGQPSFSITTNDGQGITLVRTYSGPKCDREIDNLIAVWDKHIPTAELVELNIEWTPQMNMKITIANCYEDKDKTKIVIMQEES